MLDKAIHFLLSVFSFPLDLLKVMCPACFKQIWLKCCECDVHSYVADELRIPLCAAKETKLRKVF